MGSNGGGAQKSMLEGLSRQGSLYNLTLDEVQQQLGDLGKPLNSMNLDELLKSVSTAEGNQGLVSGSSLDLRKKTVDEVWQDIQHGEGKKSVKSSGSFRSCDRKGSSSSRVSERQGTLGEMTLEDFLVKAGVVAESSSPERKNEEMVVDPREAQWMQYRSPIIPQQQVVMPVHYQVQQPLAITGNPVMDVGYSDTRMAMSPTPLMGSLSDAHMSGRKRYASGAVVEKTVERRQKRMIKNRESAARSRARKQAYTNELENKISRLEEENERLRREKYNVVQRLQYESAHMYKVGDCFCFLSMHM
nr:abscisic acid-insensitive 5-like protein 2 [Tanacetum cinerariifolium]